MIHHILYMVNLPHLTPTLHLPYTILTPKNMATDSGHTHLTPFRNRGYIYTYTRLRVYTFEIASRYVALVHWCEMCKMCKNRSTDNVFNFVKRCKAGVRCVRWADLRLYKFSQIRQEKE